MARYIFHREQSKALRAGAEELLKEIAKIDDPYIVLALPGGRTTSPFLVALSEATKESHREVWSRVEVFVVDERLVPLRHPDSNFGLVLSGFTNLLQRKFLTTAQLHPFVSEGADEAEAIESYVQELKKYGGRFHLSVVSSGEDGHIAGLFPNHSGLLEEGFFATFHNSPKPPPHRMTTTRSLLEQSDAIFLFFLGEGKREALAKFKDTNVTIDACPAKIINNVPTSVVITDLE